MDILQYPFDSAAILQKKRSLKKELLSKTGLVDKKIAIVSGSTVGEIRTILELFLLHSGIRPTFWEGEYGLFYEDVVFDSGELAQFAPDILYIHTSNRNLRHWPEPADTGSSAQEKLDAEYNRFEMVWNAAKKLGCPVIQNTFELPLWRNFGSLDAADSRGRVQYVQQLNSRMAAYAQANPHLYLHDLGYLAASFGLDEWCDSAAWYGYKYTCAVAHIPDLCHSLASLIKSLFGKSKKSIALDLDNTLWGGIIGDAGAEGIELGDETPAGRAFASLQNYLRVLSQRGILLNVASKNEESAALSGFLRQDSPLKREDFLCFEAHWEPKSLSIVRMAKTLNILPDSFVFMDDNPAEISLVQQELPEVTCIHSSQPEDSIRLLDHSGLFEAALLSGDDMKRTEMYRQNAQRQQLEDSFSNYEEYLRSLDMKASIGPFKEEQVERITQLINKTNQFNLTTRRYTTSETQQAAKAENSITLAGRLVDKFGDNGITSAIIATQNGSNAEIDLWIMSCRVFKRNLEQAMFDALVQQAAARGITTLTGRWLPTAKNLLAKDFYATIGFALVSESETERVFRFTIPKDYQPLNTVITIEEF